MTRKAVADSAEALMVFVNSAKRGLKERKFTNWNHTKNLGRGCEGEGGEGAEHAM